ncbi:MAG TPA: glycosyltransferase family 4 protein [Rhodocyclaceae bacterium]|nr:glycosyltransferase family 4 protein [Rhodocyclaceae bacterium]
MKKTRKLRIVHTESSCGWGGQEIRILEEARGMQARGHRVVVLCPEESKLYKRAKHWGVEAVALPIANKRLRALLALRKWLKHSKHASVINTHSSTDSWLTAIALRTFANKIPVVRTRHISAPVAVTAANRWLYGHAAQYVVTTGEQLRRELIETLGLSEDAICSIPTGIDTQRYVPGDAQGARDALGIDKEAYWVGIVATLRSWKGHSYLMEAIQALTDRKIKLLVVGEGPQLEALQQKVEALGIEARVHFAGNQQNVVPWLQAMDVFVLPSYANEGVSQAVMQAMCVGLPIITTAVGSMTDVIRDRDTGLLVATKDSVQIAEAIRLLEKDRAFAAALGKRAHAFAQEHCGLDRMLDRMEEIFQRCAKKST